MYSTVPKQISFHETDHSSIGSLEDDNSSDESSSSFSTNELISQLAGDDKELFHKKTNNHKWDPDFELFPHKEDDPSVVVVDTQPKPDAHELRKAPKPVFPPPRLDDWGYITPPRELQKQCGQKQQQHQAVWLPRIRSRVSLHTRIERWQHQIGKPFRAISSGLRHLPGSKSLDCFGGKVVDDVMFPISPGNDSHGVPGLSCSSEVSSIECRNPSTYEHPNREKGPAHEFDSADRGGLDIGKDVTGDSPGCSNDDTRWLYARSLWPLDAGFIMDQHPRPYDEERLDVRSTRCREAPVRVYSDKTMHAEKDASTLITSQPTQESSEEGSLLFSRSDLD